MASIVEFKTRIITDVVMFLSSYFPLFLILCIKDICIELGRVTFIVSSISFTIPYPIWKNPVWSLGFLGISLISLIVGYVFIRNQFKDTSGQSVYIEDIRLVKSDMLNYTIPFLVGLIGLDYTSWPNRAVLIVFLCFMFSVLVKQGAIFFNPMLLFIGVGHAQITYSIVGDKSVDNHKKKTYTIDTILKTNTLLNSGAVRKLEKIFGVSILK